MLRLELQQLEKWQMEGTNLQVLGIFPFLVRGMTVQVI